MSSNPERDLDLLEEMLVDGCVRMFNAWEQGGGTVVPPVLARMLSDAHSALSRRHGTAAAEPRELSRQELLVELRKVTRELEADAGGGGRRSRLRLVAGAGAVVTEGAAEDAALGAVSGPEGTDGG